MTLHQEGELPLLDPETLLALKDRLFEAWRQLPPEHQATVALALVKEVQEGEWGTWLNEASGWPWPEDEDDFPFLAAGPPKPVDPAELLPAPEGENPTDFDKWMRLVDESIWEMAGCSVYDLPDIDFRALFEDRVTPSYAADEALINAGFSRFE